MSATFSVGTGEWSVVFSEDLANVVTPAVSWAVVIPPFIRVVAISPVVAGDLVSGTSIPGPPGTPPNRIVYTPGTNPLIGVDGLLVDAFSIEPDIVP